MPEKYLKDYLTKTDEELAGLAGKDKLAANALVLRYSKTIFIKSRTFSSPSVDVDDLNQEGLMGLLKAAAGFDPDKGVKFSTFAEVCISNQMKSYLARTKRGSAETDLPDNEDELPDETNDPEKIYLNKEFFSGLWKTIYTSLSDTERQVFNLCVWGASYREAAKQLNITEKSVDNAMQRARKKIRKYIDENN